MLVRAPEHRRAPRSRRSSMASAARAGREGDDLPQARTGRRREKRGTALHGSAARFIAAEPRKTRAGQGPSNSGRPRRSR
ncbi:hypothetical protein BDIM_28870 [Brevundimonas diminuta ATCC 11568]|nr:hypothetical protein BDIM_28870 [Brevundimonas diminuta ATCC 11568]